MTTKHRKDFVASYPQFGAHHHFFDVPKLRDWFGHRFTLFHDVHAQDPHGGAPVIGRAVDHALVLEGITGFECDRRLPVALQGHLALEDVPNLDPWVPMATRRPTRRNL